MGGRTFEGGVLAGHYGIIFEIFDNLSTSFFVSLAYCPPQTTFSTRGSYAWPEISAEENYTIFCKYGGVEGVDYPVAWRRCDEYGIWEEPVIRDCLTLVTSRLKNITVVGSREHLMLSWELTLLGLKFDQKIYF